MDGRAPLRPGVEDALTDTVLAGCGEPPAAFLDA